MTTYENTPKKKTPAAKQTPSQKNAPHFFSPTAKKSAAHNKRGAASRTTPTARGKKNGIYGENVRQPNISTPTLRPRACYAGPALFLQNVCMIYTCIYIRIHTTSGIVYASIWNTRNERPHVGGVCCCKYYQLGCKRGPAAYMGGFGGARRS